MNKRQTIDVDDLVVDEENPRFEAVSTEDDALYSILADQKLSTGNKILNLARDIAAHGLNASELLVVSPIEGTKTYLVREGNRRVTAIKLSLDNGRIPEDFRKLAPQFAELAAAMQAHRRIECCVCDDEQEIRRLLLLRHGGENNGIGTVKWNSTQTTRFNEKGNPQTARALSFAKHLQEDYGQGKLWKAAAVIPPTNLGRLITTPEVRKMLNIDMDGNDAHYFGGHDALLLDVLEKLKAQGVTAIFYKDTRIHFIEEAAKRVEPDGQRQTQLPLGETAYDRNDNAAGVDFTDSTADDSKRANTDDELNEITLAPGFYNPLQQQPTDNTADQNNSDTVSAANPTSSTNTLRKKPVRNIADKPLFGHTIRPRGTESNNIYSGIAWIDKQYLKNPDGLFYLLPILGFSLRLLMESVAREYFASIGEDRGDKSLTNFLKDVAKPAIKSKLDTVGRNNFSIASEWIDGKYNFEAFFSKWAHGTVAADRSLVVRQSELVALIIDEVWT